MQRGLLKWLGIFLLILFVAACSDDDNPTEPEGNGNNNDLPEMTIEKAEVPSNMKDPQNPQAYRAYTYVQTVNSFSVWSSLFVPPEETAGKVNKVNDEWERTWSDGDLTVTWKAVEEGDNYVITVRFDGQDDDRSYDNFLFYKAERSMDGSSGSITFYDQETGEGYLTWEWNKTGDAYHMEMNNTESGSRVVVETNGDKSGWVESYVDDGEGQYLYYKAEWSSDGTGSWWEYDSSGSIVEEGTWS